MVGKAAQWLRCFWHEHVNQSSDPKVHVNRSSVISAQKTEMRIPQSKQDNKTSLIDKLWV